VWTGLKKRSYIINDMPMISVLSIGTRNTVEFIISFFLSFCNNIQYLQKKQCFDAACVYNYEQLKEAGMECRASKGQCDLPEYCSGTDPVCPSDVYRRNTDSCSVNGVCQLFFLSLHICLNRSKCLCTGFLRGFYWILPL